MKKKTLIKQRNILLIVVIITTIFLILIIVFSYLRNNIFKVDAGEVFYGGITNKTCPGGYVCKYNRNNPDASGKCVEI